MSVYKNVQTAFWTDTKVVDDFTPEDRYFYLYLFTNPHTNLCGCYEITMKQMTTETGYSTEKIEKLLERFSNVHKVTKYCPGTKELLLINWHKYNWTSSVKFIKALEKEIANIKCPEFKGYLISIFKGTDTVFDISEYGINSTDIVNDTDPVKKNKRAVFTPPTVEEVRQYCAERKNTVDPESFVNFYTSKGWKIGKETMRDWQAAVRTWEKNSNGSSNNAGQKLSIKPNQYNSFPQREYSTKEYEDFERKKLMQNLEVNNGNN